MARIREMERRKFARCSVALTVRYRFLSLDARQPVETESLTGYTQNISQGGLLLIGRLPDPMWARALLKERILLTAHVQLTQAEPPVKALCRVVWLEPFRGPENLTAFGLAFREITSQDRDRVLHHILSQQM
jgi:c-di-GMP-binding flagellar brake protein YcgR